MSAGPQIAPDAAMALGIASTAMPFARTRRDEAERWLRILRLHGVAGTVLQSLGVSETALPALESGQAPGGASTSEPAVGDAVSSVTEAAARISAGRKAAGVSTADVLLAVMQVYGEDFNHVLGAHGADRDEVLERLRQTPS